MKELIGFLMLIIPAVMALLWLIFDFIKYGSFNALLIVICIIIYIGIAVNLFFDN